VCDKAVKGLYCTGWVKRGPTGIINSNIIDARETVAAIVEDINSGCLLSPSQDRSLLDMLQSQGKKSPGGIVTWQGFQKIDAAELAKGQTKGKVREKFVDVQDMVRLAL